ncbi:NAD(P)/FAD-dependent oxidoreductase [Brevibacillus reuszeri]|uniref:NAD(P)/FAD-dependent oxidoreductase n=1 Tax=Brevibacillus reuszeri TaxID=54915 RepID=UPI00289BC3C6|nr:NAD(P)/FAD-dependent oxidoreductase [Brevibacillus reuszeri]
MAATGGVLVIYDTVIIGGGISGLQTAIQLARSLRHVVVLDIPGGRSLVAKTYRNILGYPEEVSGDELRRLGRQQAKQYGAMIIEDEAVSLEENSSGEFIVRTKNGVDPLVARTIVMATGIRDPFPAISGMGECLGSSIFLCPDCDGFESVGEPIAVIGAGPQAVEMADELSYYTQQITVLNHAAALTGSEDIERLKKQGFPFYDQKVRQFLHEAGQLQGIELESGERVKVTRAFLAFPGADVQTGLLAGLQVHRNEKGHVRTDQRTKETEHRNIWAVGDITMHSQQVAIAMGDGAQAAIWIQKRLREYDKQLHKKS